jgi:ribosomal protein L32
MCVHGHRLVRCHHSICREKAGDRSELCTHNKFPNRCRDCQTQGAPAHSQTQGAPAHSLSVASPTAHSTAHDTVTNTGNVPSECAVGEATDNECVVCMDARRTHTFVPCGHVVVCQNCGDAIMEEKGAKECPFCTLKAIMVMKVYLGV